MEKGGMHSTFFGGISGLGYLQKFSTFSILVET